MYVTRLFCLEAVLHAADPQPDRHICASLLAIVCAKVHFVGTCACHASLLLCLWNCVIRMNLGGGNAKLRKNARKEDLFNELARE